MLIRNDRDRNRILLILFVGVLMGALDIAIVGPALPAIQSSFRVDDRALAWIFTIYVLFNLVSTPLMAKLSDVFGRRLIYVIDVTAFALGSLLVAISPTFAVLLVGRAVQGLGAGGIFPVASAVIGDTFPPERRGRALGLIGAVFGIAFLVGPVLAGAFLAILSWHWLFLVNLPIAMALVLASWRHLPATRPGRPRPLDWPGMITLGILLAALAYGINRVDTAHFAASLTSAEVWPFLAIGIALLPVLIRLERTAIDPVVRLSLFRSRQVVLASILAIGAGLSEAAVVFVPSLLVAAFHVTSATASFMLMPAVLAMAIGSPLFGRMLDHFGSKVVVRIGTGLLALGMIAIGALPTTRALYYTIAILVGLGLSSLLGAPLRYVMLNEAPREDRAAAQGLLTIAISIGQLTGGALVGAVAASQGGGISGYRAAFLAVGLAMIILALMASGLKGRTEELATVQQHEAIGMR